MRVRDAYGDTFRRAGLNPRKLAGKRLSDILPEDLWTGVRGPLVGVLAGRELAFAYSAAVGEYHIVVTPLRVNDEVVGGLVVIHELNPTASPGATVDTEEEDARESRRRQALSLAGIGTWELDLRTGNARWSEEYHALYGVDPQRFVASREAFQRLVLPEDRSVVAEALDRIARDGIATEIRYRISRPSDGAVRILRSHVTARIDSDGKPAVLLGTGQDVSDLVMVLSQREREMLMLLAEGLSGTEIAAQLVLSPATVRTHIRNAIVKLGAHTRGQAIAIALRSEEIGS